MRKYYIDNLRVCCILLLFPFHTAMIFNNWGEAFYIHGQDSVIASTFISTVYPWWMTLLFVMAGMSSYYALQKRSTGEYAIERRDKLLIPFFVALVSMAPLQSYIADLFHNGYEGNFFSHYKVFFTRFTDMTGYDGGFTPAHLWFMIYLYGVSMMMLPLMKRYMARKGSKRFSKMSYLSIFLLFAVVAICTPILNVGKSVGESLACFAIGFFIFSNDRVQDTLERFAWVSGGLALTFALLKQFMWMMGLSQGILWDLEDRLFMWTGILFWLGLFKKYFNGTNKVMAYLSVAAFPLYYFHQTILVVLGYFVLKYVHMGWLQYVLICIGTFVLSILCYEICRRNSVTAKLFGIKKKCKQL